MINNISTDFATRMSRARIAQGMSQEALAEAVYVSARTISRWESGGVKYLDDAYRVSQVLGIPLDDEPSKRSDMLAVAELLEQARKIINQYR